MIGGSIIDDDAIVKQKSRPFGYVDDVTLITDETHAALEPPLGLVQRENIDATILDRCLKYLWHEASHGGPKQSLCYVIVFRKALQKHNVTINT